MKGVQYDENPDYFLFTVRAISVGLRGRGGESGSGGIAGIDTGSQRINGQLTGDIWYEGGFEETYRFNLETGTDSKISNLPASPSRDGSMFVTYRRRVDFINAFASPCNRGIDVDEISVMDTRTGSTISSFRSADQIIPLMMKLSQSRIYPTRKICALMNC